MGYIALFICYDGVNWVYPNPNEHRWEKANPASVQTWLRDKCTQAIKESIDMPGERKFWALSPCSQPEEFKDVLNYLRNVENFLERQVNLELQSYQNELARSDYGDSPSMKVTIKFDEIEPFIGKSDKKQKKSKGLSLTKRITSRFRDKGPQSLFASVQAPNEDVSDSNNNRKEFSWFCGVYAQGRMVRDERA